MKKLFWMLSLCALVALGGCGTDEEGDEFAKLREEVRKISDLTGSLAAVVGSDYATCPASGDTSDDLIRKICNVAQAATNEAKVELKGQLALFAQLLQSQVDAINSNLSNLNTSFASLTAQIATINASLTALDGRLTTAESAIVALQALTSSITGTLAGNMIILDIGSENASAGPLYESVLRRNDRTRFNGYVEALGSAIGLPNNPAGSTNGSANVVVTMPFATATITIATPGVVTWTAHGRSAGNPVRFTTTGALPTGIVAGTIYYIAASPAPTANTFSISATPTGAAINTTGVQSGVHTVVNSDLSTGDIVRLSYLTEGGGFSSGDLVKEYTISASAANYSTITLVMPRLATATAAFGGTVGVAQRVIGRGMSTMWASLQASDTAVRVSNLGSKRYNFVIRRKASDVSNNTAELCYDITNNAATFATINAAAEGGAGNITCK